MFQRSLTGVRNDLQPFCGLRRQRSARPQATTRVHSHSAGYCSSLDPRHNVCRFFVSELHLSEDEVNRSLDQYPQLLHLDVAARARPVARCLKSQAHTTPEDLGKILLRHPQVFGYCAEDRVEPVLQFLRDDVALGEEELRSVVTRFPVIFSFGVKAHLRPQLAYLYSLGVSAEQLPGLVFERPLVLGEGIDLVITHIKAQGVPRQQVSRLLRSYPIDYRLNLREALAAAPAAP